MQNPLGTVLTEKEADTLCRTYFFTRQPGPGGVGYLVECVTPAERHAMRLALMEIRDKSLSAGAPGADPEPMPED
jgi:hypothetical protein